MPRAPKDNKAICIRLEPETISKLNYFCQESGQTKTFAVERAIESYIDSEQKLTDSEPLVGSVRVCLRLETSITEMLNEFCYKTGFTKSFATEKAINSYIGEYNKDQKIIEMYKK